MFLCVTTFDWGAGVWGRFHVYMYTRGDGRCIELNGVHEFSYIHPLIKKYTWYAMQRSSTAHSLDDYKADVPSSHEIPLPHKPNPISTAHAKGHAPSL